MVEAIALLRQNADKCERQAKRVADEAVKADLYDMSARWHWLAREMARLQVRVRQLEGN